MNESKSMKQSTTAGRKRQNFRIRADPGSDVYISGTFNSWNGEAKKMKDSNGDGEYSLSLLIPPGRHEYKFVINEKWHVDPECPNWVVNDHGTLNSVIHVEERNFMITAQNH